ncbi:MAG: hypothetical protein ACYSWU_10160 [Planctomycetota bacterium]|jgi:hypothetical protein
MGLSPSERVKVFLYSPLLLLVGILLLPARVDAQDGKPPKRELPKIVGVRVGFAGRYRVGLWTPVQVTLRGGSRRASGELSLIVPDGDGVPSRVSTPVAEIPAGENETPALLYARFGRIESELTVELAVDDRVVDRKVFVAADTDGKSDFLPAVVAARKMIVSVGPAPLGVEEAVGLLQQEADRRPVVVRLEDAGQLPRKWIGYEGVDTIVLSTSRPGIYGDFTPGSPRIEALKQWVRLGGKLIVCVGSQAGEFHGDDALLAPLAQLLPGKLQTEANNGTQSVKIFTLRQTSELETYCKSSAKVPSREADGVPRVPNLIDLDVDSLIEAREAALPLVVRAPRGFGEIVFFAGDLDRQPLSGWQDRPRLVSRLLALPAADAADAGDRAARTPFGFDDMAGQLRSALDQFSEVSLVPFWVVVTLIVVYILLIGPGDYFFLRKVTRRMEWTWLTFPLIVLIFSIGAYAAAHWLKGDQVRINQVDLVDVDVGTDAQSGLVRGTSWMNVYSPRATSFDFSLRPKLPDGSAARDADVSLSWLGLPGEFLGGMSPRVSGPVPWAEGYEFSPELDSMQDVPIQIWSTKSLTARWTAQARDCPKAELVDEGQFPAGSVTNTLNFPLSKCFLIYGRQAYTLSTRDNQDDPSRLGTLRPGESTTLDDWTWRSELKTLLTGRSPYDQSSVELAYILRAMMFFEEAGGRGYTGLGNGYQDFVDLTHLLKANRAILVAVVVKGADPSRPGQQGHGAQLLCKDRRDEPIAAREDQHVTIYRFVFPVKKGPDD